MLKNFQTCIPLLLCISQCTASIFTRSNYKHHRKLAVPISYQQQNEEWANRGPIVYHFMYKVNNPETNDYKIHEEARQGDNVKGHYSLIDPDGHLRTVNYTADKDNGFVAKVERVPIQSSSLAKENMIIKSAPVPDLQALNHVKVNTPLNYYYY
jgi:hypothetical protein